MSECKEHGQSTYVRKKARQVGGSATVPAHFEIHCRECDGVVGAFADTSDMLTLLNNIDHNIVRLSRR
jgi:hypothetical protein